MPSAPTVIWGWTVVIGVLAAWWYFDGKHKARRPLTIRQSSKAQSNRKDAKANKVRNYGGQSSGEQDIRGKGTNITKKGQNTEAERNAINASRVESDVNEERDDDAENKEFARQLSSAKAGTLMPTKSRMGPRQKSVKQSRALEKHSLIESTSDNNTTHSSVTEGDADDDASSCTSIDPKIPTISAALGDVSDMLEKPPPGPSVLRLTESANPLPSKKPNFQPNPEPSETKKQRQNRKKVEKSKELREEAEKERKRLLEQQRCTVREAEGRAAKDGRLFMASQAPATSSWAPSTENNGAKSNERENVPLLDTFNPPSTKDRQSLSDDKYPDGQIKGSEWANLPSEEEQIRFSIEASQNWELVTAKEKRNKKIKEAKQDGKTNSPIAAAQATAQSSKPYTDEQEDYGDPRPIGGPSGPGHKWGVTLCYVEDGEVIEKESELVDSEWEVS